MTQPHGIQDDMYAFTQGHNDAWTGLESNPPEADGWLRIRSYLNGHKAGSTARYYYDAGVASVGLNEPTELDVLA